MMAGLQRSATTFRRSGSSGLVWDERFLTEDAEAKAGDGDGGSAEEPQPELRHSKSVGSIGMMRRVAADDGGDNKKATKQQRKKKKKKDGQKEDDNRSHQVFKTKDIAPDVDPPSPRVSGCILCSIFSGSGSSATSRRAKPRKK